MAYPQDIQDRVRRLARAAEGVLRMVEDGKDVTSILDKLKALSGAANATRAHLVVQSQGMGSEEARQVYRLVGVTPPKES
jgi:DNA-binding FrmR family transcriptional regulator